MEQLILNDEMHQPASSGSAFSEREEEIIQKYYKVQPLWQFSLLCFFTMGIYQLYWLYRNFKFFKEWNREEGSQPFWRAFFVIFFGYTMFKDVLHLAQYQGYKGQYSPGWLLFALVVVSAFYRLPEPLYLISVFSFLALLPVLQARNYFFKQQETEHILTKGFVGSEITIMVVGVVFFLLVVLGLVAE